MDEVRKLIDDADVGAELSGIPPMSFITFKIDPQKIYKKRRTDFYTHLIRRGVFLQPFHHGYICYRHTKEDLDYTIKVIKEALFNLKGEVKGEKQ
jgi:glutamate-1-semialdehyde aminotransferase